jgi:hypothetical protein
MGGVGKFLFGSPGKEKTESGNHAWPAISDAFSPALGYVTGSGDMMSNLLGLGGGAAQTEGLKNYANSGGMQFLLDEGTDSINSNMYARGLGQSGAAMKGLEKYRSGLASTYLDNYMKHLQGLGQLGLGAGGVMSDAGQWSKGDKTGAKKGNIGSVIKAGAAIFSDVRGKKNIERIGEYASGLPKYKWEYKEGFGPEGRFIGPMAHEVKEFVPEAYIPNFVGEYAGVDYSKLGLN